jgi:hypothetical protein
MAQQGSRSNEFLKKYLNPAALRLGLQGRSENNLCSPLNELDGCDRVSR